MAVSFRSPRGVRDILPGESDCWRRAESAILDILRRHGYDEIRLPVVESTELFARSVGEHTDIVAKEMYSFPDRKGDSLTLRPEGTAGCVRAAIQHSLLAAGPVRLWYSGPMFRYERPQQGRYRQFEQLGLEAFGMPGSDIAAEILALTWECWRRLAIEQAVTLEINTLGDFCTRRTFGQALTEWLRPRVDDLDADSRRRLDGNPLRIFDSKVPKTQALLERAPALADFLDADSKRSFEGLQELLTALGVPFRVNPRIVRGLDYYTGVVFEWTTELLGAQCALCAGGRYDGLVESLGGPPISAMGMAIGMDRVVELLSTSVPLEGRQDQADLYVLSVGDELQAAAMCVAADLRRQLPDLCILCHCGGGALKKRMKRADQSGARLALILGENERLSDQILIKPLRETVPQELAAMAGLAERVRGLLGMQRP